MNVKNKKYFISGIGTDVGKTIVAAVLAEAWQADYWKPIQAGELEDSDSDKVRNLISNAISSIHPEAYRLTHAMSPHAAAKMDKVQLNMNDFTLPNTSNVLLIEGAGGLMVPLNESNLVIDFIAQIDAEVILVSKNYLGSINHTLLSAEALRTRSIKVRGIIFNCDTNVETEEIILQHTGFKCLGRIPAFQKIDKEAIKKCADNFKTLL